METWVDPNRSHPTFLQTIVVSRQESIVGVSDPPFLMISGAAKPNIPPYFALFGKFPASWRGSKSRDRIRLAGRFLKSARLVRNALRLPREPLLKRPRLLVTPSTKLNLEF